MVEFVKFELDKAKDVSAYKPIKTADARRIAGKLFKELKNKPTDYIFGICEDLLKEKKWAMGVAAFSLAHRMKSRYEKRHFEVFEYWLETYITGWGDCDDFCTHAFGELICQYTDLSDSIVNWTKRKEFWMRRASAVILILSIRNHLYNETKPLRISDLLITDKHELVHKGHGWMLKTLSIPEPDLVCEYLLANKNIMPRTTYRISIEKMNAVMR